MDFSRPRSSDPLNRDYTLSYVLFVVLAGVMPANRLPGRSCRLLGLNFSGGLCNTIFQIKKKKNRISYKLINMSSTTIDIHSFL